MLHPGDGGTDEESKMANLLVNQVNDTLAANLDVPLVGVGVDDPVERLPRRRDVVAVPCELDDRRADGLQIELPTRPDPVATGAPFTTTGPVRSGLAAANNIGGRQQ